MSTETTPAPSAEDITAATKAGTEYGDKRDELAYQLYEIGSMYGAWQCAGDDEKALYLSGADAALQAMPHLLSYDERERLAPFLPALALKPEEIVTGERGTVERRDPETLGCVCGNHTASEGFIQTTAEGIAVHVYATPTPEALAPWPQDEDELHTLCPSCGRLYRDETIRTTNTAPVARLVDLADGTPAADALEAHYQTPN